MVDFSNIFKLQIPSHESIQVVFLHLKKDTMSLHDSMKGMDHSSVLF